MSRSATKLSGRAASTLRAFHRGEDAQGMVFGAISLFMLVACIGLVHNSGVVTSRRIQAQTAADAAAYSGSLVTANILSDAAWLNDGMAYIYYNLMRYAVDVTVYRTLAEIKDHNYWPEYKRPYAYIEPPAQAYMTAGGDPLQLYYEAYHRAADMIPDGENWLRMLSDVQNQGLGEAGRDLVQQAVLKTAAENSAGVAAVAFLQNDPHGAIFRHPQGVEDIDMILEYDAGGSPLWSIIYNGQPYADIYRLGPDHWRIVRDGMHSLEILRRSERDWHFATGDLTVDVLEYPDGSLRVHATGDETVNLLCIPTQNGWAVTGTVDGTSIEYTPFEQGGYMITVGGESAGIRMQDGAMQQWNSQRGRWEDIPTQDSITIGGQEVPISRSNEINLPGNATLHFPNRLRFGPIDFTLPNRVSFQNTTVTLLEDTVRVDARVGNVGLVIEGGNDNCATLNGRSTCDPGSAVKRGYRISGVFGHDRIETEIPGRRWIYKWRAIEAIFTREDLNRFGHHSVADAEWATAVESTWTEWFDPGAGARKSDTAYHYTVPCWNEHDYQDGARDGYFGHPLENEMCVTCNPNYSRPHWDAASRRFVLVEIDYDQRLETTPEGDYILDKDGDGRSDVRKYGVNSAFFRNRVTQDPEARDFQSIQLDGVRPMCLTGSVFAHPLVVAVWVRPDKPFLGNQQMPELEAYRDEQGNAQVRRTGPDRWVPFFRNPEWGYFAIATARVGVLDSASQGNYRFTFDDDIDLRYEYDFGEAEFLRRLDARNEWLASWHNHYEPVWTARLASTSEGMHSVDMEVAHRQDELDAWDDVGRNFVWRMLARQTSWYDPNSDDLEAPALVNEAGSSFRSMRGPHTGVFHVNRETPPEQLLDALRH